MIICQSKIAYILHSSHLMWFLDATHCVSVYVCVCVWNSLMSDRGIALQTQTPAVLPSPSNTLLSLYSIHQKISLSLVLSYFTSHSVFHAHTHTHIYTVPLIYGLQPESSQHPLLNHLMCAHHIVYKLKLWSLKCMGIKVFLNIKLNYTKWIWFINTFSLRCVLTPPLFHIMPHNTNKLTAHASAISGIMLAVRFTDDTHLLLCHCAHFVQGRLDRAQRKGGRWKWKRKRRIAGLVCPLCPGLNGLLYTGSWDLVLVCITLTPSIKVRRMYKKPKMSSWSPWPDPHPSETDAVLEYFLSNISPSLSLFLSLTFCLCSG